jgi:hypothetical protein
LTEKTIYTYTIPFRTHVCVSVELKEPWRAVDGYKDEYGDYKHPRLYVVPRFEEGNAHRDVALDREADCGVAGAGKGHLGKREQVRE